MSILLISRTKFFACRQRKERNGTCCYYSNCKPPLLPPYVQFVPANRYDWHKYRNTLNLKNSTYEMGGTCNMNGIYMKRYTILVENPERKRPLWSPKRRWGNNIKVDPTEVQLRILTECIYHVNKSWNLMKGKNESSEWKNLSFSMRCKDSRLKSLFLYAV